MKLPKFFGKPKKPKLLTVRRVHGESMLPALKPGKLVAGMRPRKLRPGDVVMFTHGGLEKIKRVSDVSPDGVFVTGDNPHASTDSRTFGWLPRDAVITKIIWPRRARSGRG